MNTDIFNLNIIRTVASVSLLISFFVSGASVPGQAQNGVLKGGVQKEDYNSPGGGLSRSDITRPNSDPFASNDNSGGSQGALDPGSFQVETAMPPAPPAANPFALNANDSGDPQGQMMQGVPGQMPQQQQQQFQGQANTPQNFNPADPDSSPDMQLQWDAWHKRVAEVIWTNFTNMANMLFAHSPPMAASCAYTVTREGRIVNVHMLIKNPNPAFNAMVLAAIASIDGNAQLLTFPPGSRRMTVDKSGTFSQNYGQAGFRYVTNDRETIPGQRRR